MLQVTIKQSCAVLDLRLKVILMIPFCCCDRLTSRQSFYVKQLSVSWFSTQHKVNLVIPLDVDLSALSPLSIALPGK